METTGHYPPAMPQHLINRDVVYWFGCPPEAAEDREFRQRGLSIRFFNESAASVDFAMARAAVFSGKPPGFPSACGELSRVRPALDHGLLVYLLAEDDTAQAHLGKQLPAEILEGALKNRVRRRTGATEAYEIAEVIARHDAGSAANPTLEISLPPEVALTEEQRFLIMRAFSDCRSIALKRLPGGRSANVFAVQATLSFSVAGPRPLPFFVKLDSPKKILKELDCYGLYAAHHIPWYLRPNLDAQRCLIGVTQGVLVGSFVDQSESLWEAVQKGKGSRYIHALFEDTLMGWRSQAYRNPPTPSRIANSLSTAFKYEKVDSAFVEQAQQWGLVKTPKELWEHLLNLPAQPLRNAPMHGDMHGENVRVRNNDSIIIDLANAEIGPLCADLASLDVWLSFEVSGDQHMIPDRAAWTAVVRDLYAPEKVSLLPNMENVDVGLDWLRGSIRQIRMISGAICECDTEYSTAVAIYLLRRASYTADTDEDAYRRAFAYWLGAQLVENLSLQTTNTTVT